MKKLFALIVCLAAVLIVPVQRMLLYNNNGVEETRSVASDEEQLTTGTCPSPSLQHRKLQKFKPDFSPLITTKAVVERKYPLMQTLPADNFGIVVLHDQGEERREQELIYPGAEEHADNEEEGERFDGISEETALNIRKAKELAMRGNRKLALKLFKHALALDPQSIDALTNFGEFLEDENKVVQADLLYQRALAFSPDHQVALASRERTAPLVARHDAKVFDEIDRRKRELYASASPHSALMRSAMKEFYYQHVYHTVALEGNKMSLDEMRAVIEHRHAVAGKSLHEHNEVVGMSEALQYLNNTLLMRLGRITVDDIRSIHKRVLGFNDPIVAGQFRSSQVFVGRHIPPHPSDVDEYMSDFELWLNSAHTIGTLHPVEYAALAHYRLVFIHPFLDGNGRTARLLMNFILMRHGIPPVSIRVGDRWVYYETLRQANDGDVRPFVRFVARCTRRTLDDYLQVARLPAAPTRISSADRNKHIFAPHRLTAEEILRRLFDENLHGEESEDD